MIVFYATNLNDKYATLLGDEYTHCAKVLRKKEGDDVFVTDGFGVLYGGIITKTSKKEVIIDLTEKIESQPKKHNRSIAIAPTKNIDRLEWFLEKATEIGISNIYPFLSSNSERKVIKPARLEKIILSAMKQSKNFHKPVLHPLSSIKEILQKDFGQHQKYIAHCMNPESHLKKIYESCADAIVLIGPEGDFTAEEVALAKEQGWIDISLGDSRLRTETAGIIACHLLNL